MSASMPKLQSRCADLTDDVRIHYLIQEPASKSKGYIVLIHGFPETSYQFRKVQKPLAEAGYTIIVPDTRGAGKSSKPNFGSEGFTKTALASDLHAVLYDHLKIKPEDPVHIVGQDIGGMVAVAYASLFKCASVIWGECPMPGTKFYDDVKGTVKAFHFNFHTVPDLPEALTQGREGVYLRHFYYKLGYNHLGLQEEDLDHYSTVFAQPGAMRCGFNTYRAFSKDAEEMQDRLKKQGKIKTPCLVLNGDHGYASPEDAQSMGEELFESFDSQLVEESGHWCAEENPQDFTEKILAFVRKH